ncbi:MAG: YaaL family protein [Bacillota bacterium]
MKQPKRIGILGRAFLGIIGMFALKSGEEPLPGLMEDLESARREWKHARLYFNSVTDPDLIDYAIFYMGATEKKYVYLLKQAREIGMNIENYQYGLSRN